MLGAILGDIIGSPYEFDRNNIKTKEFPLFSEQSHFTDDTVMTLAVAEGLISGYMDKEKTRVEIIKSMQRLGRMYPYAGYGDRFVDWLNSDDPQPYNSFGNGSAMRVSAVAWIYDDIDTVLEYAELTASVTHNHPDGIKGAQATAAVIFLARNETSKDDIRKFIEERFEYDLSRTCDEIRPTYRHEETCQETVPQAITAFLEGTSFEDVIKTAVSLGGDSDTLAAIAGSIAEAFYGVPDALRAEAKNRLSESLFDTLETLTFFIQAEDLFKEDPKVTLYITGMVKGILCVIGIGFEVFILLKILFDNSLKLNEVLPLKNYISVVGLIYQAFFLLIFDIRPLRTLFNKSTLFSEISTWLLLVAIWLAVYGIWIY